jgi:hypothetical protein
MRLVGEIRNENPTDNTISKWKWSFGRPKRKWKNINKLCGGGLNATGSG